MYLIGCSNKVFEMSKNKTFSRNLLPILGVSYLEFKKYRDAVRFAVWARTETAMDEHPCETEITWSIDTSSKRSQHKVWTVKVSNW